MGAPSALTRTAGAPVARPDDIHLPRAFDWAHWLRRWEAMQARHLPRREERLRVVTDVVALARPGAKRVVDLGCGAGCLTDRLLRRLPGATVVGVDLDPRLLALARRRLEPFGRRAVLVRADLRDPAWARQAGSDLDAAVSATTLHWLSAERLAGLYRQVAALLAPGGAFLNADHVASSVPGVQQVWDEARNQAVAAKGLADDWRSFWDAFNKALGVDGEQFDRRLFGPWEGVEEGLPLAWHSRELAAAGFAGFDCYWRCGGDAVYGALRAPASAGHKDTSDARRPTRQETNR
jgi:SAM-dependent methyltransferase